MIEISVKALKATLAAIKPIVKTNENLPILSSVLVSVDDGTLSLTGTDLDVEITATMPIESGSTFAPVVIPITLLETATSFSASAATLSMQDDGRRARVAAGRSRYDAIVLPASDFPRMRSDASDGAMLDGATLKRALSATVGAASTEEARYYLCGTCIEAGDDGIDVVATDGFRLRHVHIEGTPPGIDIRNAIIVPTRTVNLIAAHCAGDVRVALSESRIVVRASDGTVTITSKLIDGSYPAWRRLIPESKPKSATLDAAEMAQALARLGRVADAQQRATKSSDSKGVKICAEAEGLRIVLPEVDASGGEEFVPAEITGDFADIGVSIRYLSEMISAFAASGAETVMISQPDNNDAMICVEDAARDDLFGIVMLMRVK